MNYKTTLSVLIVSIILVTSLVFILAKSDFLVPASNIKAQTENPLIIGISKQVLTNTDNVFLQVGIIDLGTAIDVDGRVVQGYLFVHDKRENAKPPWAGGGKDKGESKCYSLFAKGASWKTTEPYITGTGVDLALTEESLNTWDSEVSFNVFGTGTSGATDGADTVSPDGKNEVMFENLGPTNTIAYAIVWGIFSGPPFARELVEWDVVFNSDFAWSETGEEGKMDYQNIATHEFGHALGLGHPEDNCIEETMYAYAGFGETKKQTLEAGDIAGISKLYN